jgi:putative transposase
LHAATYRDVRARFGLPAQLACNVPRQVGATYQALLTTVKANAAARAAGVTTKRYRGLDQPPKYVSPTLTYNYRRDYSLKAGQQVSLRTLDGRVVLPYSGFAPAMWRCCTTAPVSGPPSCGTTDPIGSSPCW